MSIPVPEDFESGDSDPNLPGYHAEITRRVTAPEFWRQTPVILNIANPNCTFGSFISGSVSLTPERSFLPTKITVLIIARERSGRYGDPKPTTMRKVVANATFPNTTRLLAGYSHSIPFNIKFPDEAWMVGCKCGQSNHHDTFPPSLGSHYLNAPLKCDSSYYIRVVIEDYPHAAYKYINFTRKLRYDRELEEFTSYRSLPKSLKTMFKTPGRLLIKRKVLFHSGNRVDTTLATLQFFYIPRSRPTPPEISTVEYKVYRCVFWDNKPLENLEKPQKEQLISSGKHAVTCHWSPSRYSEIVFPLNLDPPVILDCTYTGCITAIRYKVVMNFGRISITQPLVIGSRVA